MSVRYVGRPMTQPAVHDFGGTVRRGLRNLRVFSGRDTRPQFWLYMAAVYGALSIGTFVFMIPSILSLLLGHDPFENGVMMATILAMAGMLAVLLAAALTRRLHDTGRRGAWALLPIPPFGVTLSGYWLLAGEPDSASGDVPLGFVVVYIGSIVYMAGIVIVGVLCALPGKPGTNRYGPPAALPPVPAQYLPPPPPYLPPPPGR